MLHYSGVLDMHNKDTGDVTGDTSFGKMMTQTFTLWTYVIPILLVLSRRLQYYECLKDPSSFSCNGVEMQQ